MLGAVNNWSLGSLILVLQPLCLGDEGPDFVDIDDGTVVVGGVVMLVEVPHTNLAEVTGMVLVEVDSEHRKKIY